MKYVVILGDGMADYRIDSIGGTPLEIACTENIDRLAESAKIGLVKTIPDGFAAGSDTANMSVLGYAPEKYYSGRSPLEALAMGVPMADNDVAMRCNLVTLSDEKDFRKKRMVDYSAGEISSDEARVLIKTANAAFGNDKFVFYAGFAYRHCLIVKNGNLDTILTPPHDISGKVIGAYLPENGYAERFLKMYEEAYEILSRHPVNLAREKRGQKPANCIWLWGAGTKPTLDDFSVKYGKKGAVISAVDLLKGIGRAAGMEVVNVEGATGNVDTNYRNKALAALEALKRNDFCYVHIEAPDECGHRAELENKIRSIEQIDKVIVKTIVDGLRASGEDFAMLILPDHPTPIATRTHARNPVPFLMYREGAKLGENGRYNEKDASLTGVYYDSAPRLMSEFLSL